MTKLKQNLYKLNLKILKYLNKYVLTTWTTLIHSSICDTIYRYSIQITQILMQFLTKLLQFPVVLLQNLQYNQHKGYLNHPQPPKKANPKAEISEKTYKTKPKEQFPP